MDAAAAYALNITTAADRLLTAADSAAPPREALLAALVDACIEALAQAPDGGRQLRATQLGGGEKVRLDQILRSALLRLVDGSVAAAVPLMQWRADGRANTLNPAGPPTLQRLLDMLLCVCEEPVFEAGLVLQLVENAMETITIDECGDLFVWLEANLEAFRTPRMQNMNVRTLALRTCNNLLRRLSKGRDAVLCGRVMLFLARMLPLDDRSGLNIPCTGNLGNATPIQPPEEVGVDSNGDVVDLGFYQKFWGLQRVFQQPAEHTQPAAWAAAVARIGEVYSRFSAEHVSAAGAAPLTPGDEEPPSVKYLSSSRLLKLQLRDASFRRHFLLQVLIFLHSVRVLGKGQVAPKDALKPKQEEEAAKLEVATYRMLEGTPEQGTQVAAAVRAILADESQWVAWKREVGGVDKRVCGSFARKPYTPPESLESRVTLPGGPPPAVPGLRVNKRGAGAISIDGGPLDDLWNQATTNMEGLEAKKRKHCPDVHEFLEPLMSQMAPDAGVDEDFQLKRNPVYVWRGLRMVARVNINVFAKAAASGNIEDAARGLFPLECPPLEVAPAAVETPTAAAAAADATEDVADGAPAAAAREPPVVESAAKGMELEVTAAGLAPVAAGGPGAATGVAAAEGATAAAPEVAAAGGLEAMDVA